MRPLAITFHQLLINELTGENEECALIILKILMEHIRIFRVRLNNELGQLIDHWKNAIAHIKKSAAEGEMFKLRPTPVYTDLNIETCIENVRLFFSFDLYA
jgi:hypothetical protein